MMQEKRKFQLVTSSDVCLTYRLLLKNGLVSFPLTQEGVDSVDALVSNIVEPHFGEEFYKTPEEKAVAYLFFLIKDHPFTDGNKRTAILVFQIVCVVNNLTPSFSSGPLDEWAVFIEQVNEQDHQTVIKAITKILFPASV